MTEFEKELKKIPQGEGYFKNLSAMLARNKNVTPKTWEEKEDLRRYQ